MRKVEESPAADVLTAEEEYLLQVFRRYRKGINATASPATAAASGTQRLQQLNYNKRSPSPPLPKTSPPISGARFAAAGLGAVGQPSSLDGKPAGSAGAAQPEESPGPAPTDTLSRAKMILEKKRKAAAAGLGFSRAGSAASSGASGLRKAKITKVAGTPSSGARLDPVKVGEDVQVYVPSVRSRRGRRDKKLSPTCRHFARWTTK